MWFFRINAEIRLFWKLCSCKSWKSSILESLASYYFYEKITWDTGFFLHWFFWRPPKPYLNGDRWLTAALVTGHLLLKNEHRERDRAGRARALFTVFKLPCSPSIAHINQNQSRIDTIVKDQKTKVLRGAFFLNYRWVWLCTKITLPYPLWKAFRTFSWLKPHFQ